MMGWIARFAATLLIVPSSFLYHFFGHFLLNARSSRRQPVEVEGCVFMIVRACTLFFCRAAYVDSLRQSRQKLGMTSIMSQPRLIWSHKRTPISICSP